MARINIVIERIETVSYRETVQMCVKEEPTAQREVPQYGSRERVVMRKEYAPTEVTKSKETTTKLLEQSVDSEDFNLVKVIEAINNIV